MKVLLSSFCQPYWKKFIFLDLLSSAAFSNVLLKRYEYSEKQANFPLKSLTNHHGLRFWKGWKFPGSDSDLGYNKNCTVSFNFRAFLKGEIPRVLICRVVRKISKYWENWEHQNRNQNIHRTLMQWKYLFCKHFIHDQFSFHSSGNFLIILNLKWCWTLKLRKLLYRLDIYELLNRTSTQIVRVAAASC